MRISDWSSDVCSSDLNVLGGHPLLDEEVERGAFIRRVHRNALEILGEARLDRVVVVGKDEDGYDMVDRQNALLDQALECAQPAAARLDGEMARSEEHTSELQSLMRTSYAVFCLKKQTQ